MRRALHRLAHRPTFCLWCAVQMAIPALHGLESWGLSVHGVEAALEQMAMALSPYVEVAE